VANPLAAQLVLEGRVLDDATGHPLASARVLLLNRHWRSAGRTVTDEEGRFRFERSGSGQYRLDIKAMGYLPTVTPLMWMVESGFAGLEVRLSPNAVLLAPLEIVALSPLSTSAVLDNVEHRRTSGFGYQITREDIEERRPMRLSDILVTLPGVSIGQGRGGAGARSISMGRALPGCQVQIFLDGVHVKNRGGAAGDVLIDDLVSPLDVEVVEVFRGLGSIPPEFLTPQARCGVVAIWTRRSP
jgi:5-hydroxyisourate hydrolase-like protein (transthyretin family)